MNLQQIRVLLIEDNPGDARLLKEHLTEASGRGAFGVQFALTVVDRLSEGKKRIEQQAPDVVLLDLSLPDSHGLDTFDQLAASAPSLPIVVLSGLDDSAVALDAVRKGAQDFLVKGDVSGSFLIHAIRHAIQRKKNETARNHLGSHLVPEMKMALAAAVESIAAYGSGSAGGTPKPEHLVRVRESLDKLGRLVTDLENRSRLES